jgi:hypothetical protein
MGTSVLPGSQGRREAGAEDEDEDKEEMGEGKLLRKLR